MLSVWTDAPHSVELCAVSADAGDPVVAVPTRAESPEIRPTFPSVGSVWLQAIFQSACELYHFLQQACKTAERLAAKAVRKRRTTAQILSNSLQNQGETLVFVEAVSA